MSFHVSFNWNNLNCCLQSLLLLLSHSCHHPHLAVKEASTTTSLINTVYQSTTTNVS